MAHDTVSYSDQLSRLPDAPPCHLPGSKDAVELVVDQVDSRAVYAGTYREPIVDAGTAMLDRLMWVARTVLPEQVAELHPGRHAVVAAQIRELIGN